MLDGRYDAGLIIHENRFTYEAKGLKKIVDLGEYWEATDRRADPARGHRHSPLAYGRREAHGQSRAAAQRRVRVRAPRRRACPIVRAHAQEMSEEVMYKHIDLYVNHYSVDLGAEGRRAVELLFDKAAATGVIPRVREPLFMPAESRA